MKRLFTLLSMVMIGLIGFSQIVITEISYNGPESGTDTTEFIELYNKTNASINMMGYTFTSGVVHTFPNVSIPANGYLVVALDSVAIMNVFGASAIEWTSGGLSNGGEPIALKDASGNLIDSLRYDDNSPWPAGGTAAGAPDGGGATIVFCDTSLDNTNGANWSASTHTVTGKIVNGKQVYGSPGMADSACFTTPPPPAPINLAAISAVTTNDTLGVPDS
ncbi:MAG: lamin tail domain-containing protein, partial [Salibacteraceae bacterium]